MNKTNIFYTVFFKIQNEKKTVTKPMFTQKKKQNKN